MPEKKYDRIYAIARKRGIFWPSSELYGGLAGFYDYGPVGSLLKQNIEKEWKKLFIAQEGMLLLETPNIMPEEVFRASGHLEHFADPLVSCTKCGQNYRADKLIEEKLKLKTEQMSIEEMNGTIIANKVSCQKCKSKLGEIFKFNLMFGTQVGPGEEKRQTYLRPETAQGAFVSFERLWEIARKKLPFGAALVGRSYRNEISPRQGMIRLREFSQAEAEVFFNPEEKKHPCFKMVEKEILFMLTADEQKKGSDKLQKMAAKDAIAKKIIASELQAYYLALAKQFFNKIGFEDKAMRCRQQLPEERAHYSIDTWDIEIQSEDFGWVEVAAIADRGDYDLKRHSEVSKKNLTVTMQDGKKVLPHVMEASFGIDRPVYLLLEHSFRDDGKRTYFNFNKKVAPFEASVFPLVNKDGLPEKALEVFNSLLKNNIMAQFDSSGNIGKMYARADEIGTPVCITIDHDTLKNETVTVRDRDTTKQKRVHIKKDFELLHEIWESD